MNVVCSFFDSSNQPRNIGSCHLIVDADYVGLLQRGVYLRIGWFPKQCWWLTMSDVSMSVKKDGKPKNLDHRITATLWPSG